MHESRNSNSRANEQLILSWWLFALQSITDVLQKCCFTRSSRKWLSGTSCIELKQFSRAKFHENNCKLNGQILDLNLSAHSMIMCFHYIHHFKELKPQHHCKCCLKNILQVFQVTQPKIKSLQNILQMREDELKCWTMFRNQGRKNFTCNLKPF